MNNNDRDKLCPKCSDTEPSLELQVYRLMQQAQKEGMHVSIKFKPAKRNDKNDASLNPRGLKTLNG